MLEIVSFLLVLLFGPVCLGFCTQKDKKEEIIEFIPDFFVLLFVLAPVVCSQFIFGGPSFVVFAFWAVASAWIFLTYWLGLSLASRENQKPLS